MNLWELFVKGGPVMYPLLLCSLVTVAIGAERILHYRSRRSDVARLMAQLQSAGVKLEWLQDYPVVKQGAAVELLRAVAGESGTKQEMAQRLHSEGSLIVAELRNYTNYLDVIVTLSPLLGLLGTVTGMISSFSVLAGSSGQPFAITGGVAEALIATATGLSVAIVALIVHSYLAQQEDGIIQELEMISNAYLKALYGGQHGL